MMGSYLKLHRKMLQWGWYNDKNTKILFLHCLLKANWKPGEWQGVKYEAGEFITSLETLAKETMLTISQVRTAIHHLEMTGEITNKSQGKCRVVKVNNWCAYQEDSKEDDNKIARKSQGNRKEIATDKEYITGEEGEELKEVKHIYGEYKHVRLTNKERDRLFNDYGEEDTLAAIKYLDEYMQMKGKSYKDHNLALRKWVFDAVKRDRGKQEQGGNFFDLMSKA